MSQYDKIMSRSQKCVLVGSFSGVGKSSSPRVPVLNSSLFLHQWLLVLTMSRVALNKY